MLSKEEQKQIRKNLREYSRIFDQQDVERGDRGKQEEVEHRRRLLEEWLAWRANIEQDVMEEREARGLPLDPLEGLIKSDSEEGDDQVIEEIVEEIIEETEEIVG
jgi:translation initiation factor 3 subunit B